MNAHSTCNVVDCLNPIKSAGMCYSHYMKQWRYGTPTPEHKPTFVDVRGKRFGTLIVVERDGLKWLCQCDCGRTRLALAGDLNRYGDKATCGHKPSHRMDCGYYAAHSRIKRDRGGAAGYDCVDCGNQASQWSYNHDDDNQMVDGGMPYSVDTSRYSPRCVPCHKIFDLSHLTA